MIEDLWYRNAIIYSLNVDSFMDANGDGCGDFEGLMRRLDYIESLGVDAIWLGPFQMSPDRDNGYDISDFYAVNPQFGSSGDFVEFMQRANSRGIRVLIDLVVNHTSDQHPWFKESRDPTSRRRDWYVWSPTKKRPKGWNKGMVFPGVQKSTWTRDPESGYYYFHRFYDFQPDLNMDNPDVRTEVRRIMGYWLQLGVSGFRMDAVPFVIEGSPKSGSKPPIHFEYLEQMRSFLDWRTAGAIMLGEANVLPEDSEKYFGKKGEGIHMMFNFWVNQHLFYTLASGDARPLVKAMRDTRNLPRSCQWAQFLRNHDELDLGRLTTKERELVLEKFGPDADMQLYQRGIRRRLASMLGERNRLELAYSMLFALPGTPVLRYGDEIGMGEDLSQNERDAVRTPMQWSHERNAGFSTAEHTERRVMTTGPYGCDAVNVEAQRRDPNSLLNWMVRMIRVRKECPEIGWGEWTSLATGHPGVLALQYDWRGNSVVVIHNFTAEPRQARIRVKAEDGGLLANLLINEEDRADEKGIHRITLEAYGYKWFRVGGLSYALDSQRDSGAGFNW